MLSSSLCFFLPHKRRHAIYLFEGKRIGKIETPELATEGVISEDRIIAQHLFCLFVFFFYTIFFGLQRHAVLHESPEAPVISCLSFLFFLSVFLKLAPTCSALLKKAGDCVLFRFFCACSLRADSAVDTSHSATPSPEALTSGRVSMTPDKHKTAALQLISWLLLQRRSRLS